MRRQIIGSVTPLHIADLKNSCLDLLLPTHTLAHFEGDPITMLDIDPIVSAALSGYLVVQRQVISPNHQ
jgi:hypothetical protein